MRARTIVLAGLAGIAAASAAAQPSYEDRRIRALAWPELQRFESEGAFKDYLRDLRRLRRELNERRAETEVPEIVVAQADVECPDPEVDCLEDNGADAQVVVT